MLYYLVLFLIGIVGYVIIIGWKQIRNWSNIATFYIFYFALAYLGRPLYYFLTNDTYLEIQYKLYKIEPLEEWNTFDWLYFKMGIAVIFGLFSFAFAFKKISNPYRNSQIRHTPYFNLNFNKILKNKLIKIGLIFAFFGILSIFIYRPMPGIRDMASSEMEILPEGSGIGFAGTTGYFALAERFIVPASVIILLLTGKMLLTLTLILPFIISHVWYGWGRQSLLHLTLSLLLAVYFVPVKNKKSRKIKFFIFLLFLIVILSIMGILGMERTAFQSFFYEKAGPITDFWENSFNGFLAMLVGFEISLHWIKYTPDIFPFQYGANYLYQFFLLPIPRILWSSKRNIFAPENYNIDTSYLYGAAPGCIGDAWMNGGWIGIIVLFTISGLFLGWIQGAKNWQKYPYTGLLIYITGFPLFISAVRDGLSVISIQFYFIGLPIFFCFLMERMIKKSQYKFEKLKRRLSTTPLKFVYENKK